MMRHSNSTERFRRARQFVASVRILRGRYERIIDKLTGSAPVRDGEADKFVMVPPCS